MASDILKNIFNNLEKSLCNDMNIRIEHDLEDGKYREYLIRNILSKIIPAKYSVTNGFIIDSENNKSKEMDIIIYDKSYVPPFFDETYTVVPIEAVIAVIQVKTTLTSNTMKDSIENLNSIDCLKGKVGGKIISANGLTSIIEKRYISPFKILISYKNKYSPTHDFKKNMKDIDIIYIVDEESPLIIKDKIDEAVVNDSKEKLIKSKDEKSELNIFYKNKLALFSLNLLEKMKLVNNSIIINYGEYIKGGNFNE